MVIPAPEDHGAVECRERNLRGVRGREGGHSHQTPVRGDRNQRAQQAYGGLRGQRGVHCPRPFVEEFEIGEALSSALTVPSRTRPRRDDRVREGRYQGAAC